MGGAFGSGFMSSFGPMMGQTFADMGMRHAQKKKDLDFLSSGLKMDSGDLGTTIEGLADRFGGGEEQELIGSDKFKRDLFEQQNFGLSPAGVEDIGENLEGKYGKKTGKLAETAKLLREQSIRGREKDDLETLSKKTGIKKKEKEIDVLDESLNDTEAEKMAKKLKIQKQILDNTKNFWSIHERDKTSKLEGLREDSLTLSNAMKLDNLSRKNTPKDEEYKPTKYEVSARRDQAKQELLEENIDFESLPLIEQEAQISDRELEVADMAELQRKDPELYKAAKVVREMERVSDSGEELTGTHLSKLLALKTTLKEAIADSEKNGEDVSAEKKLMKKLDRLMQKGLKTKK